MRFAAIGVLLLCAMAMQARAATITVTNTNDSGPGSLRQALTIANDGDTINFAVTGTIGLTSGGLLIAKNVTISGPGSNQLSIDGNQAVLVFGIVPGKTATISGLSIRNGQEGIWNEQGALAVNDCVVSGNSSGLYSNYGMLTVSNCAISGNSAGGLYSHGGTSSVTNCVISGNSYGVSIDHGMLTVSNCAVSGNSPYGGIGINGSTGPPSPIGRGNDRRDVKRIYGDDPLAVLTIANSIISGNSGQGVYNISAEVTILNSTITGNSAGQFAFGGGIYAAGFKQPPFTTISNSTISGNSASGAGGGIFNGCCGPLAVANSTISGNSAGDGGGGIANYYWGQIANSTFSGNSAPSGGGIYNSIGQSGPRLEIGDTILNAGASGENIFNNSGTVTSDGYNVCSDNGGGFLNGPGDQINTNPLLGPLQDNGGPTLTHAPLPGSPAIDAGAPNFTPPPYYDQRGPCYRRVYGRRIDVGSVEIQRPRCPTPAPRPTPR